MNSLFQASFSKHAFPVSCIPITTSTENIFSSNFHFSSNISARPPIRISCQNTTSLVTVSDHVDVRKGNSSATRDMSNHGIGITNFLQGKSYFITGATGFLGKALIEKMLRAIPDVVNIFLLIKAKDKEDAKARLYTEIIESDLFKFLKQIHGESYKEFMMSKLVPVIGNMNEPDLGMDADTVDEIAKKINVIINSAANTNWHERYDLALNTNTKGPSRLLSFAKKCPKLSLFCMLSTAYVNGNRLGKSMEKPFSMGQSIAAERSFASEDPIPELNIDAEVELASTLAETFHVKEANQKIKDLGLQRARMYGWRSTYEFTKAMGEMVISEMRGQIPVVIIRPSIIESTYKEPFPGWIQGNRMVDPFILQYGKGNLPVLFGDSQAVVDLIPVDMVVNATLAAVAKHGISGKPEVNVYHVGSSDMNPLSYQDMFNFCYEHFIACSLMKAKIRKLEILKSMDEFSSYIYNVMRPSESETDPDSKLHQKLQKQAKRKAEYFIQLANIYKPYMFNNGLFDNSNMRKMMEEMSFEEKRNFGFDVCSINWRDYITNVHIPGLKTHVMMGRC
ncbi:fatty acyl-CoA reductase 2-like [Carica papaya]|uniref:fatty acyl-CoA reductase 2-like n=1 Tax=Carica papaya TaxID=3649 RepID=UPI000B8CF0F8|nr:fatty acyl-CoA reductase 2-like [Carica papaya]